MPKVELELEDAKGILRCYEKLFNEKCNDTLGVTKRTHGMVILRDAIEKAEYESKPNCITCNHVHRDELTQTGEASLYCPLAGLYTIVDLTKHDRVIPSRKCPLWKEQEQEKAESTIYINERIESLTEQLNYRSKYQKEINDSIQHTFDVIIDRLKKLEERLK